MFDPAIEGAMFRSMMSTYQDRQSGDPALQIQDPRATPLWGDDVASVPTRRPWHRRSSAIGSTMPFSNPKPR